MIASKVLDGGSRQRRLPRELSGVDGYYIRVAPPKVFERSRIFAEHPESQRTEGARQWRPTKRSASISFSWSVSDCVKRTDQLEFATASKAVDAAAQNPGRHAERHCLPGIATTETGYGDAIMTGGRSTAPAGGVHLAPSSPVNVGHYELAAGSTDAEALPENHGGDGGAGRPHDAGASLGQCRPYPERRLFPRTAYRFCAMRKADSRGIRQADDFAATRISIRPTPAAVWRKRTTAVRRPEAKARNLVLARAHRPDRTCSVALIIALPRAATYPLGGRTVGKMQPMMKRRTLVSACTVSKSPNPCCHRYVQSILHFNGETHRIGWAKTSPLSPSTVPMFRRTERREATPIRDWLEKAPGITAGVMTQPFSKTLLLARAEVE